MSTSQNSRLQEGDIMIPVLGLTGAGKSMFINIATGEPKTRTNTGIVSCTYEVDKFEVVSLPSPHRIFLVDTPGFDHIYLGELEVFGRIANWLKDVQVTIAGVIFLHDKSGSHPLRNVILTTTNWSDIEPVERQKQLANTACGDLISLGARPDQFTGTQDSAWAIIESIAQQPWKEPLSIQRDIGAPRIHSSTTQSSVRKEEGRVQKRDILYSTTKKVLRSLFR